MRLGINKFNAEGYTDPTAYEGIRNAEADAGKLKITYPSGFLELNLNQFFPCTSDKAEKVFSLVHKYSSDSDKKKLLAFLRSLESRYFSRIMKYGSKASRCPEKSEEHRAYISRLKTAKQQHHAVIKNIQLFTAGRNCK